MLESWETFSFRKQKEGNRRIQRGREQGSAYKKPRETDAQESKWVNCQMPQRCCKGWGLKGHKVVRSLLANIMQKWIGRLCIVKTI